MMVMLRHVNPPSERAARGAREVALAEGKPELAALIEERP
jgi:hypothetical protein